MAELALRLQLQHNGKAQLVPDAPSLFFFFFFYWRALRQPDTLLGAFNICSGSKFVWEASPHLPLTRSRLY